MDVVGTQAQLYYQGWEQSEWREQLCVSQGQDDRQVRQASVGELLMLQSPQAVSVYDKKHHQLHFVPELISRQRLSVFETAACGLDERKL